MQFEVVSSRIAGLKPGDVVSEDDLIGCNIEALVNGGHLKIKTAKSHKPTNANFEE